MADGVARHIRPPVTTPSNLVPRLLTLDADYSLSTIRARQLEHELLCTDLQGYFEHVWTVHPVVGASPDEPAESRAGPPRTTVMTDRHTIVEGTVAHSLRLWRVAGLNFLLAQAVLLWRLHRLVRKEAISVVRVGDPYYLALLGFILTRLNRIPLVVRVNGNYDAAYASSGTLAYPRLFRRRSLEKRVERYILPRAALVACGNQNNLEYAVANGAPRERTTLFRIGNIISPVHFVDPDERAPVSDEFGLGDRPFVASVARLQPVKRPQDALQVLARAKKHEPNLALVLIGDGPMREQLEQMSRDLRIEGDVVFAGARDQDWVARALTSAAVVVSPVTGRALVEAALSGTPIVAYDYEWQAELLRSGSSALLVGFGDIDGMARAVCELLADPARAASLGRKARHDTLEMMNPENLVRHERRQYDKVLRRGEADDR